MLLSSEDQKRKMFYQIHLLNQPLHAIRKIPAFIIKCIVLSNFISYFNREHFVNVVASPYRTCIYFIIEQNKFGMQTGFH